MGSVQVEKPDQALEASSKIEKGVKVAPENTFSVPDDGLKAWKTIAGVWLVMFASLGYLYSFGVYEDFYVVEYLTNHTWFHATCAQITIFSLQLQSKLKKQLLLPACRSLQLPTAFLQLVTCMQL
ncbi:MFS general substrate transporter [Mycena venus]|uniref:MFS general substrate transporter n=1 Tax=Mycena venus TaxID=2733690 RepID=A0A8H7CIA5_9AGAR|nr:MFS general substrate transporter [Mycena venus]